MLVYWLCKHVLLGPIARVMGRPRFIGLEHVPRRGAMILAGNHVTIADSFFLALALPRRVSFVAKSEYFTGKGPWGAFVRWWMTTVGQVPIDRRDGDAAAGALAAARRILAAGEVWGIYPEGTRSPDGRLYRGRTGVMRVALTSSEEVPVIPMVVRGTETVDRPGNRFWRRGYVEVEFLPPMDLTPYRGRPITRELLRAATDDLMAQLAEGSGQTYVDEYAPRKSA